MCQNGACDWPEEFIPALRVLSRPLISAMNSERTRLSGVAIDLIGLVASGLGSTFEPLLKIFFPVLLALSGRTNKVIITRARACIIVIIETTQLPSILPYFLQSVKDKSTSLRLTATEGTLTCMNCFNPPDLEKDTRAREIEAIIRATARDANADIRKVSRKIFEAYKLLLPGRVDRYVPNVECWYDGDIDTIICSFTGPLTPTMRKYLDIKTSKIQPQPTISRLTPTLEAKGTLSASTSAVPSTHRPTQTHQTLALHSRSASSSAISTDKRPSSEQTTKPVRHMLEKSDMPPPQYMPVRPSQPPPSHTVSISRSTSIADARKRTVSTLSRSTTGQIGLTRTINPGVPPAYPARPASASSLCEPPRRSEPKPDPQSGSRALVASGPRRVPLPEVLKEAVLLKVPNTRVIASTSKPQPTFKPARNNPVSAPDKIKPASRPAAPGSGNGLITGTVLLERIPKARGVTQPTLAQLARTKPAVERKGPSITASKPLWGRSISKASGKKIALVQKVMRKLPEPPVADSCSMEGRSNPAQIPLPPSPSPSITQIASISRSPTPLDVPSSPPLAPLLGPMDLPMEDEICATDKGESQNGREMSTCTHPGSSGEVVAPSNQTSADGLKLLDGEPTTPQGLLVPRDFSDPASNKTPISALLSSIQRGFLFTPSSPLSPPQSYLSHGPASDGMKDLTIPFPLHIDRTDSSDQSVFQAKKPFMFGIVNTEASRHALGSVENLNAS